MFLALIFTAVQTFAADTSIPGLASKTLILKSSNVESFCAAKITPELKMVEGRPSLILDDVRFRWWWHQMNTPEESLDIEQTENSSTMKLISGNERVVLKIKDDTVDLSISYGKRDKNGIFHINKKLQSLRCLWAAK